MCDRFNQPAIHAGLDIQIFTLDQEIRQTRGKEVKFGVVDVSSLLGWFGVNFDKTDKKPTKIFISRINLDTSTAL